MGRAGLKAPMNTKEWFETHVYIAAWLAPIIALVGIILQNNIGKGAPIAWPTVMLYIAFLTCLAAALTTTIEPQVRIWAGLSFSLLLGYFMMSRGNE
jgi:hypothetical protein